MHDHDNGRDPTAVELRRWNAVDVLDEAAVENELVGNNKGASSSVVPDEPIFNSWVGRLCLLLPSYLELEWEQRDNCRSVGFRRGGVRYLIRLETKIGYVGSLTDFTIESVDDFAITPEEAVSILRKTFPDAFEI